MSVLAAAVGTPIVSIPANTFKNEGLVELLNYPLPVRQPADEASLQQDVEDILANPSHFREAIGEGQERVAMQLDDGLQFLRQRLNVDTHAADSFPRLAPETRPESGVGHEQLLAYQKFQVEIDAKRGLIPPSRAAD